MGNSLEKFGSFIDGLANDVMKPPPQPSDCAWKVAESGIWFSIDLFIIMRVTMFECIPCMRLGTHFAYNLSDLQNCARYVLHIIFPFFRHLTCQGHVAWKRYGSKSHYLPSTPFQYLYVSVLSLDWAPTPMFSLVLRPIAQRSSVWQGPRRRHECPVWHRP